MTQSDQLSDAYLDIFSRRKFKSLRSRQVLPRYLDWLFKSTPLDDALVYDIGGGNGLISFYAAERGAKAAICVEPLGDGSRDDMLSDFAKARETVRNGERVTLDTVDLVTFAARKPEKADVIVLHNVVNHLDEDACAKLDHQDPAARAAFIEIFETIAGLLREGGTVIVADAGRDSFWTKLGLHNPFAPTIDRQVHQQPEIWQELMEKSGFQRSSIQWTPFVRLMTRTGGLDRPLGARALSAYYTLGHFVLTMRKPR